LSTGQGVTAVQGATAGQLCQLVRNRADFGLPFLLTQPNWRQTHKPINFLMFSDAPELSELDNQ
jgi:hypothetical protein